MSDDDVTLSTIADIKTITYRFDAHCKTQTYQGIHKKLYTGLSETIEDTDQFFTSTRRVLLKDNSVDILRRAIVDTISAEATETTKPERIAPIVNQLPIYYRYTDHSNGRSDVVLIKVTNTKRLTEALKKACVTEKDCATFYLGIDSLEFRKGEGFTGRNFDHIGDQSHPIEPSPDTSTRDTNATNNGDPQGDILEAVKLLIAQIAQGAAPSGTPQSTSAPQQPQQTPTGQTNAGQNNHTYPSYPTNTPYNVNRFPKDVRDRIRICSDDNLLMTRSDMVPYKTNIPNLTEDPSGNTNRTMLYFVDPPDILVTLDGHEFRLNTTRTIDKRFTSAPPPLPNKKTTPENIRRWYHMFLEHCKSHGVFLLPYYCFRRAANNTQGFTCGEDDDFTQFDLPSMYSPALSRWSNLIGTALKDIFPSGSRERSVCEHFCTDGYAAVCHILAPWHPVFNEYGPTLAMGPPHQGKNVMLYEYFNIYMDYLEMRAYCENNRKNLNDFDEMTKFLLTCRYGNQILPRIKDERSSTNAASRHKYTQGQIIMTLEPLLPTLIDKNRSPFDERTLSNMIHVTKTTGVRPPSHDTTARSRREPHKRSSERTRTRTPVKQVAAHDASIHAVETLIASDDIRDSEPPLISIYKLGIDSVKRHSTFNVDQACLVCKETGHTFENCPVLNNHSLLKELHIAFCALCRKTERKTKESGAPSASIHSVRTEDTPYSTDGESSHDSSAYSLVDAPDF